MWLNNPFPVISNLSFLFPAWIAYKLNHATYVGFNILMMFCSMVHHICNTWLNHCLFPAPLPQKSDFFFAQLLMIASVVYLIDFGLEQARIQRWILMSAGAALFVVEIFTDESFVVQLVVAGVAFAMITGYWIGYVIYHYRKKGKFRFPPYDWEMFSLAIALTGLACLLFGAQRQPYDMYDWVHTVWHLLAGVGQGCLMLTRPTPAPRYAALDADLAKQT